MAKFHVAASKLSTETLRHGRERGREREGGIEREDERGRERGGERDRERGEGEGGEAEGLEG